MIDDEIIFASVVELGRLFKRKKISPVELTRAYLRRIERHNPKLHAFATVTDQLALEQATQAEKELHAGLSRGPLHGIPFVAKDLFATRGYPTTWGAKPLRDQVIDHDAAVIRRLRDAGAVLLGKTAMTELAGGPPVASATGACRTPWDLTRWSGGSSSGSGAAVAAGLSVFALGTETWGSIMTPASFCGITGLRPTFGRISRDGAMTLSWTMDKVGAFARTVQDCSIVFDTLRGRDPEDPSTVDRSFKVSFVKARERTRDLRIGYVKEDFDSYGDPDVATAFNNALGVIKEFGFLPVEITLPDHPYEAVATTIIAAEEGAAFDPFVRAGHVSEIIDPDRRGELLGGQLISAVDYLRCQRVRSKIGDDFLKVFSDIDILVGPSTLQCAPPITATLATIFPGGNRIEAAENLLGLPAISLPCGFNRNKLPIGLKFIGQPYAEAEVLMLAHLYQSITPWHTKQPRL